MQTNDEDKSSDSIKHIIVLMLENRSFHTIFSDHPKVRGAGDIEKDKLYPNIPGESGPDSYTNLDWEGRSVRSSPYGPTMSPDIADFPHDHFAGIMQAAGNNGGFVKAAQTYDRANGEVETSELRKRQVMGYFPYKSLPVLHSLADHYMICNRWFSSIKGPTWPNRNFAVSGTTETFNMPDDKDYTQNSSCADRLAGAFRQAERLADYKFVSPTIFHRLREKDVPFKIYFHDLPSTLLHRDCWTDDMLTRHVTFDAFYADAAGPAAAFPAVAWLEPAYAGPRQNDGHPPAGMAAADRLVGRVYNAVRANPDLWRSSLLLILCDEHGGLFDPVPPPPAPPPAPGPAYADPAYTSLGFRVPCLVVSPWAPAAVDSTVYDHTSWLAFARRKFGLGDLGGRAAAARDFGPRLLPAARADAECPPPFGAGLVAEPAAAAGGGGALSEFQGEMRELVVRMAIGALRVAAGGEAALSRWSDAADMVKGLVTARAGGPGGDKPGPAAGGGGPATPRPRCCGCL